MYVIINCHPSSLITKKFKEFQKTVITEHEEAVTVEQYIRHNKLEGKKHQIL